MQTVIYTISTIAPICAKLKQANSSLVLATGFFDLLHSEHLNFLAAAKAAGDILIVGVESDTRARTLKGEGRPVETQQVRATNLFPHADYVLALPEDFSSPAAHAHLLAAIRPDILAISSHTSHQQKKQDLVKKIGGQLQIVYQHNPNISTSLKLVNKL